MIDTELIEIFYSIQGEGLFIGYPQLFIRFSECNLNCSYCDTPLRKTEFCNIYLKSKKAEFLLKNPISLNKINRIIKYYMQQTIHSIALTGNEPLLSYNFIKKFAENSNYRIFLETNGTLPENLNYVIDNIDFISMDFKLNSITGNSIDYSIYEKFVKIAKQKKLYIKLILSEQVTDSDISDFIKCAIPDKIPIIIQPVTKKNNTINFDFQWYNKILYKLSSKFTDVRIIPQTHKFLKIL